mmetsp:Transcript_126124/g.223389  ORF Transcript_126124/g.223389 Transcript_126124/m.223389 type:complete len:287 (-) Transcript_126124:283-1143(-)
MAGMVCSGSGPLASTSGPPACLTALLTVPDDMSISTRVTSVSQPSAVTSVSQPSAGGVRTLGDRTHSVLSCFPTGLSLRCGSGRGPLIVHEALSMPAKTKSVSQLSDTTARTLGDSILSVFACTPTGLSLLCGSGIEPLVCWSCTSACLTRLLIVPAALLLLPRDKSVFKPSDGMGRDRGDSTLFVFTSAATEPLLRCGVGLSCTSVCLTALLPVSMDFGTLQKDRYASPWSAGVYRTLGDSTRAAMARTLGEADLRPGRFGGAGSFGAAGRRSTPCRAEGDGFRG